MTLFAGAGLSLAAKQRAVNRPGPPASCSRLRIMLRERGDVLQAIEKKMGIEPGTQCLELGLVKADLKRGLFKGEPRGTLFLHMKLKDCSQKITARDAAPEDAFRARKRFHPEADASGKDCPGVERIADGPRKFPSSLEMRPDKRAR
jgi:hypothetical protein